MKNDVVDTLLRRIDELSDPSRYPGHPERIEIHQTHISVVCVAGDDAYKLKKPVKLPFLDYSTPALREYFCREEVRLNRRLCPNLYLGVAPLYETPRGATFVREASAKVVDHAVLMQTLPQDRMLDVLLEEDAVSESEIRDLARRVVRFHQLAARDEHTVEAGAPSHLHQNILANFEETLGFCGSLFQPDLHAQLWNQAEQDVTRHLPLLEERCRSGFVIDGHGDLHARNVCLITPPAIYDCIEFSASFRCGDTAAEHAFLIMDLRYRGHTNLAKAYLDEVITESGDEEMRDLMPMMIRYRAMVRAKVAALTTQEEEVGPEALREAVTSARRHLNLAAMVSLEERGPALFIACGLPGTGKTHVCEELAHQSGWTYVASDRVRKTLAGVALHEAAPQSAYTPEFSAKTYAELREQAKATLSSGPVIIDANFRSRESRSAMIALAADSSIPVHLLWFQAPEKVIEERLLHRAHRNPSASDADLTVYRALKGSFEAPSPGEGATLVEIAGNQDRDEAITRILLASQSSS